MARGRPWNFEECILAIWAYQKFDDDREIKKSDYYRLIAAALLDRNVKAVENKIQNVSACDSRPRAEKPLAEYGNVQKLLRETYEEFKDYPDTVDTLAREYLSNVKKESLMAADSEQSPYPIGLAIEEGGRAMRERPTPIRSRKLVIEARKHYRAVDPDGRLCCQTCGSSFDDACSGEIIEIHHTRPICDIELAERKGIQEAIKGVMPLCPTCHRIAHIKNPPMNALEIIEILQKAGKNPMPFTSDSVYHALR